MTFRSAKKVTQSGKHVFGLFISLQFLPPECAVLRVAGRVASIKTREKRRKEKGKGKDRKNNRF